MDIDHLLVDQGPVALLRILLGRVPEEAAADGLLDSHRCFPARHDIQLMPAKQDGRSENTEAAAGLTAQALTHLAVSWLCLFPHCS